MILLDPNLNVKGEEHTYQSICSLYIYVNGISESLFKQGLCLPNGLCVTDEDVVYIKKAIQK